MKSKIVAVLALSTAIVVPAAFAEKSGSQTGSTQPVAMSSQSAKIEVTGTVVTLTTDRIDVRVNKVKAPEGTSAPSSIMAGQKTAFTLDSSSQMPQGLKVGESVDVWFTNHNGSLLATKVALAAGADQSSGTYGSAATSQSASDSSSASQPADQSADHS
jgi:Cu/Ag efflux protein CusF